MGRAMLLFTLLLVLGGWTRRDSAAPVRELLPGSPRTARCAFVQILCGAPPSVLARRCGAESRRPEKESVWSLTTEGCGVIVTSEFLFSSKTTFRTFLTRFSSLFSFPFPVILIRCLCATVFSYIFTYHLHPW